MSGLFARHLAAGPHAIRTLRLFTGSFKTVSIHFRENVYRGSRAGGATALSPEGGTALVTPQCQRGPPLSVFLKDLALIDLKSVTFHCPQLTHTPTHLCIRAHLVSRAGFFFRGSGAVFFV